MKQQGVFTPTPTLDVTWPDGEVTPMVMDLDSITPSAHVDCSLITKDNHVFQQCLKNKILCCVS
jgi:hypothetical protein